MTRFARAKGSKASNERIPNEATPWCVMKQQLDNSLTKNDRPEKMKNAKELLKEKDDPYYYDTTGNVNTDWAEIESPKTKKNENTENRLNISKKNKRKLQNGATEDAEKNVQDSDNLITPKKSKKQKDNKESTEIAEETTKNEIVDGNDEIKKKKKKNKKINCIDIDIEEKSIDDINSEPPMKIKKKNKKIDSSEILENSKNSELSNENNFESIKKKKKKSKKIDSSEEKMEDTEKNILLDFEGKKEKIEKNISLDSEGNEEKIEKNISLDSEAKTEKNISLKVSKRHKRNQKRLEKNALLAAANGEKNSEEKTSGGFDAAGNDWSSNVAFGKREKFEKTGENKNNGVNGNSNDFKKSQIIRNGNFQKKKAPKIRDDKEHKRRKPDTKSIKCVINGMEVEIVKFDGFPVKKEDAERLIELRQQMIMKGIPKSEIDGAMKLERRRAEKALARVRKQVCFHCRKSGHNLSDCPDLGKEESATGICFKCGSTEHTHFDCKITKKEEFRFASCFICREQGHIAKQCPDNPKGLYPQGGSCKICGDVTHLRKDCPDLKQEKEEAEVTLNTISESTLESLEDEKPKKNQIDDDKKAKGKIVKF